MDVFAKFGCGLDYLKRKFTFRNNRCGCLNGGVSRTVQMDGLWDDGNKLFNPPADGESEARIFWVIGKYRNIFPEGSSTISLRIDFQGYFSLATGRDLSRVRDSCASSAGFYAAY